MHVTPSEVRLVEVLEHRYRSSAVLAFVSEHLLLLSLFLPFHMCRASSKLRLPAQQEEVSHDT